MGSRYRLGNYPVGKSPEDLTSAVWQSLRGSRSMIETDDPNVLQVVGDKLADQAALIDDFGRIVMVNRAWAEVASTFHLGAFGVGDDFREICRRFTEAGYEIGDAVLKALDEFDQGLRLSFEHPYSLPGTHGEHFYQITLSRVVLNGARFLALFSREITDVVTLKRRNDALEREIIGIQQDEKRRIGREIHDRTAQELAVLHISLARLKMSLSDEQSREAFAAADNALANVVDEIRAISFLLHPPPLENGLIEALGAMSGGFARRTALRIDFSFEGADGSWSDDVEQALYRIAQEALSNVYHHAEATKVNIRLIGRETALHLIVEDDGIGIAATTCKAQHTPGVGIASMRSRIRELAGRFSIQSLKSVTRVMASAPLRRRRAACRTSPLAQSNGFHLASSQPDSLMRPIPTAFRTLEAPIGSKTRH